MSFLRRLFNGHNLLSVSHAHSFVNLSVYNVCQIVKDRLIAKAKVNLVSVDALLCIFVVYGKDIHKFYVAVIGRNNLLGVERQVCSHSFRCEIASVGAVYQYTVCILSCLCVIELFTFDSAARRCVGEQ